MDGCSLQEPCTIEWQMLETLDFKTSFSSSIEIKVLPLFVILRVSNATCEPVMVFAQWTIVKL
jgi:hypothetical protein